MNHDQLNTLRDVLIQACETQIQSGGKVINRYFTIPDGGNQCCPFACLLGGINGMVYERLTELLEFPVSREEVSSFLYSFDQYPDLIENLRKRDSLDQPMYDLGQELYTTYIKPGEDSQNVATNPVKE